ncbi:tRNA (adenosine(37)-N6)-threonylcarbamoyltransferase complex dimerization subunit type 1 TsaB [Legionella israelensis]|uniref:tRNA (adenosine(37)-N6)-threonylcarbamoyltransferase complex dimerization subunit type 1 TsaB n=1 Tax=Legionella israelensis TaxID=454 RepID=UPI00117C302A|nr:tRNA (adenosine(37)-N6)-threonylcarbamoyltransferase complex dimerization subunit type 1 TsaB [Legionella israelensis]QDP72053.1 tRNA (adenosine(37)-N6)-threonylcarbamoyltransferase complex dimerization subunit type 1 TsaB [Legionella israelensis]
MNVLAIDTSTEIASLALKVNHERFTLEEGQQKTHAKLLLPLIDRLLTQADVRVNQLDAIVFGRGPGSFTGLRVACSIAKGLAYAHDIRLVPVSTLAAIAFEARQQSSKDTAVLAVLDARMQEIYWSVYTSSCFQTTEHVSPASDIQLPQLYSFILAGVGFEPYIEAMPESIREQISEQRLVYPKASAMIELAETGQFAAVSVNEARPVYIRNKVTQGDARG